MISRVLLVRYREAAGFHFFFIPDPPRKNERFEHAVVTVLQLRRESEDLFGGFEIEVASQLGQFVQFIRGNKFSDGSDFLRAQIIALGIYRRDQIVSALFLIYCNL